MQIVAINPNQGFPPRYVASGAVSGSWDTVRALFVALAAARTGKEHVRAYACKLEWVWWGARSEGWYPEIEVRPGHGVAACSVTTGVRLMALEPLIPGEHLDRLEHLDADELHTEVCAAVGAIEDVTGQDGHAGIGSACVQWIARGRAMPAKMVWRHQSPDDPANRACWAAYHGGLCAVWHPGPVALQGQEDGHRWMTGEPWILPAGAQMLEIDRSSAYGAEASRPLPDVRLPTLNKADAEGGAIVDATVHMGSGQFSGLGLPVRVHVPGSGARIFPMAAGSWRGSWTSEMLAWAEKNGARIEIHQAWGWRSAGPFMAGMMRRLYDGKREAAAGSIARSIYSAAMQRSIGRLGMQPRNTITLTGPAAARECSDTVVWADKWRKIHAYTPDLFVGEGPPPDKLGPNLIPPWPAFVVSRAWISLCDRIRAEQEAGMVALYSDTDSICGWWPQGCNPQDLGNEMGQWRAAKSFGWAEHRGQKKYIRGWKGEPDDFAAAGVARSEVRRYFSGETVAPRERTVLEAAKACDPTTLEKILGVWNARRAGTAGAGRGER